MAHWPGLVAAGVHAFASVGCCIADVLEALSAGDPISVTQRVRREVSDLIADYPMY